MFYECLFYSCVCICSNVMCVLNHMWIKSKRFLFFLLVFGRDLYHPCFSKFFKLILCEKLVFWVFSWLISWVSSVASLNGPILKFFNFEQRVSREGPTSKLLAKIPRFRKNFQISFLKGILWDICFKLLPFSLKPLFLCFYIKTN